MSNLNQIASFIQIVESNGFAAAARQQGISTAAVSRQMAKLEKSLGTQLLQRTTRQITLTEIGEQYYRHCKHAFSEIAEASAVVAGNMLEPSGTLKVTCSRYFAIKYIIPRLPEFRMLYPKVFINLELAERFPNLSKENIDILFGVSLEGPPELVRKRVMTTRYVLCASPGYLKKYGTPQKPTDLSRHRYITHSMRKPANVIKFKNDKEVYVEPILCLNDSLAMRECSMNDMGIVKLHDYMVNEALENNQLVEILSKYKESPITVYLYYQPSRYLQPKIRKFIDFFTN